MASNGGLSLMLKASWIATLLAYDTLFLALSGGVDSTVLLHTLSQYPALKAKLHLIHVNHQISPNANAWVAFCESLSEHYQLPLTVKTIAIEMTSHIESTAREKRYAIFESLLSEKDALLMAHHKNDNAETLLFRLCRGTSVKGLASIPSIRTFGKGVLLRPLISFDRQFIEAYASTHQLTYIEDESNHNTAFSRNFLRKKVIPLLQTHWPSLIDTLNHVSNDAKITSHLLRVLALKDMNIEAFDKTLSLAPLLTLPKERGLNILSFFLDNHGILIKSEAWLNNLYHVLLDSEKDKNPYVMIEKRCLYRFKSTLHIAMIPSAIKGIECIVWDDFPQPRHLVDNQFVTTSLTKNAFQQGALTIRFDVKGATFAYRGQTKSLKKCFQTWGVPAILRPYVPLIYLDERLIAVVGYAVSDEVFQSFQSSDIFLLVDSVGSI